MTESSESPVEIRTIRPEDEQSWRGLWQQYLDFYEVAVDPSVTDETWRRVIADERLFGIVATSDGAVVGFALIVLHPGTWSTGLHAYLEDLFVSPSHRGEGVGRAMIDEIFRRARAKGWSTVYWHTQASNTEARALYDRYCSADDFVRYRVHIR